MEWLTYAQRAAVFPEGTIVRKLHHQDFPTRPGGGNRSWIAETAIRSLPSLKIEHMTFNLKTAYEFSENPVSNVSLFS